MKTPLFVLLMLGGVAALFYTAWAPEQQHPETPQLTNAPVAGAAGQASPARGESPRDAGRRAAVDEAGAPNCTLITRYLPKGDGTVAEALSCERVKPSEQHPYANYSSEALASLAYADPGAAEILSMRLRATETEAAMSYALRATALLGGDATPIVAYSNAYPGPTAIDGVPVRNTVHVKYVLAAVTSLLGDPRHSLPYFEAIIRAHSQDPEKEIALLDTRAHEIIGEMRRIQLDVTGSSTIGG